MKHDYEARHFNIAAFAHANGTFEEAEKLISLERLAGEAQGAIESTVVQFCAQGSLRADGVAPEEVWLTLSARVALPLVCQRCLAPVAVPVEFEREFRFVASEEIAEAQDEACEEDVLVLSRDFNLLELVEDELIMALPVVPKHEECPVAPKLQVADPEFDEDMTEKPNPFAVLEQLKNRH